MPYKPLDSAPPVIPVGIPSQLLERRPDIAASERNMAAANAQIGIVTAAYYPNLTLSAQGGFESSALQNLMTWPSRFWSVGPSAALVLFDANRRRALSDQAEAAYQGTVAAYRQTVLSAFQDVEIDNDIAPALEAGMHAVHIRRGPWGHLQQPPAAAIRIRSLDELPGVLP